MSPTNAPVSSTTQSVRRMSAINRASVLAKTSKELEKASSATEYIDNGKAALEFQLLALQAQLKLLEDLARLSDEEKLDTVFQLLDKHSNTAHLHRNSIVTGRHTHHHQHDVHHGMIRAETLAAGFGKGSSFGQQEFQDKLVKAMENVSQFETQGHGQLTLNSFQKYVEIVSETLGCTIYEVLEIIVMNVLFAPSLMAAAASAQDVDSQDALQDLVEEVQLESDNIALRMQLEDMDHAKYQRMKVLFDMFDYYHDGQVHFKEVVLGMYKITEDVQGTARAAMTALMMCGGKEDMRSMNFEQFARFMQNVVAASASSGLTLDRIADIMTRDVASKTNNNNNNNDDSGIMTPDHIAELFAMDTCLKEVLYIHDNATEEDVDTACDEHICFGKANRLFELWDLDHDGYINFHDLALGLRKLEETTSLKKTMLEAEQILQHFDATHNNKLDNKEFFYFLTKFSETTDFLLTDMIDHMVVALMLKENTEKDIKCVDSFAYGIDGPSPNEGDDKTYG